MASSWAPWVASRNATLACPNRPRDTGPATLKLEWSGDVEWELEFALVQELLNNGQAARWGIESSE